MLGECLGHKLYQQVLFFTWHLDKLQSEWLEATSTLKMLLQVSVGFVLVPLTGVCQLFFCKVKARKIKWHCIQSEAFIDLCIFQFLQEQLPLVGN